MCLYTYTYTYIHAHRDAHPAVARLNRECAPARTCALTRAHAHSKRESINALIHTYIPIYMQCMHTYKHTYIRIQSDTFSRRPLLPRAPTPTWLRQRAAWNAFCACALTYADACMHCYVHADAHIHVPTSRCSSGARLVRAPLAARYASVHRPGRVNAVTGALTMS
jgi:hypothetical protein